MGETIKEKQTRQHAKIFDLAHENFKKIYTDKGVDTMAMINFVENTIKLVPEEERADFSAHLMFHILLWGSGGYYEALGMLESVKLEYAQAWYDAQQKDDDDE